MGLTRAEQAPDIGLVGLYSTINRTFNRLDPVQLPAEFAGRTFDTSFLAELPDTAEPCCENRALHSFVYDAACFRALIRYSSRRCRYSRRICVCKCFRDYCAIPIFPCETRLKVRSRSVTSLVIPAFATLMRYIVCNGIDSTWDRMARITPACAITSTDCPR